MDLIDAMARASREVRNRVNAAFRRLNTHAIAAPPYEIEMPGRADTLFMYRITAISENQVESARTDAAVFFAVARRRAPGPPTVIIRRVDGGLRLTLTPAPGVETARYRIHRVRDVDLARDIGTMGPHVHELTGTEFVDDVPATWTPYYYRVVAIGAKDRENGYHPGESVPSSVAEGIRPPAAPPTLSTVEYVANTTNAVLTFRSDIPAVRGARIELQAYEADGDRVTRAFETLASLDGPELDLIASPSARELSAMPELRRQAPDRYTLRMLTFARGSIIVRDPLGRSTQISFPPVT
jgi:hypothetical protein